MKQQWPVLFLVSSIGLMSLLYACSTTQSTDATDTAEPGVPTVEIDKEIHFLTPEGEDVVVAPGAYEVKAEKNGLRLIADEGTGKESMVIDAQSTSHKETMTAPTALSFSDKEDEKVVVLLLPDGKGWEAQGSYSGVISRRGGSRVSQRNLKQGTMIARSRLKAKPKPISLIRVSVGYKGISKAKHSGRKSGVTWRLPVSDTLQSGYFSFGWTGYQPGGSAGLRGPKPIVKLLINGKAAPRVQKSFGKSGTVTTSLPLKSARANMWPKTVQLIIQLGNNKWESAKTKIYATPLSYYASVLHPIFSHDRCTTCHAIGNRQAIVAMHNERLGAGSYPDVEDARPHNPDFCGGCHNVPAGSTHTDLDLNNEWFSPADVQGINWKGWSAGRVCAKVTGPFTNKDGVVGPPVDLTHHFHDDPRILWAVSSGWVPFNRPDLDVPLKNNLQGWFNKVDPWVAAGAPCPRWRFFHRPSRLQMK